MVASQSITDRNLATIAGLREVLIKVSGDSKVINNPVIEQGLSKAEGLLQSYQYVVVDDEQARYPFRLHLDFAPDTVLSLLHKANQPIWSRERPLLVTWIIEDLKQNEKTSPKVQQLLESAVKRRGLPITQPILDLVERDTLSRFVRGEISIYRLQEISKQYGGNQVLIIKLVQGNQASWQSQWYLLSADQPLVWRITGDKLAIIVENGINTVVDTLAATSIKDGKRQSKRRIRVVISDIDSASEYAKVKRSLENLVVVDNVQVMSVKPNEVTYELIYAGSWLSLTNLIALNLNLVPITDDRYHNNTLKYRISL